MNMSETKFVKSHSNFFIIFGILSILVVLLFQCTKSENKYTKLQKQQEVFIRDNVVIKSFPACMTYEKYAEFRRLAAKKDYNGMNYLFNQGFCIMLNSGVTISILEKHLTKSSKIRIYVKNGRNLDLYTSGEFLIQ